MRIVCAEYRLEQLLIALKKRLSEEDLTPLEREALEKEASNISGELGLD